MAALRRWILGRVFRLILHSLILFGFPHCRFTTEVHAEVYIPDNDINSWAVRLGYEIQETVKYVTFLEDMKKGFVRAGARVEAKNGANLVKEMGRDIEKMMAWKVQALQRITDTAEQAMIGHVTDPNLDYLYNNAKTLNSKDGPQLTLTEDKHFYNIPVNIYNSSVHVPTNVYDKASGVINAIRWSEHLNPTFMSNYHLDPSLNWQYFGSSTGFMRQYPAMKWSSQATDVDTYDCRMRPWYIEAATSPKDMVILFDGSGSMTGLKKEIAKHVAFNILDTLNDDDHFTIIRFAAELQDVVPCFSDGLVPANMENIREYKKSLPGINTTNVANFTLALHKAFDLLHLYNRTGNGSMCNQAIMLITDGAPHAYDELFSQFNSPERHIRVFTYLIGQEMADERNVKLMACMNRGFYSHVSTLAEARDQVQHYVSVMARPLVLHNKHGAIWTSVYADVQDPKMSDWLWEKSEKEKQREYLRYQMAQYFDGPHDEYPVDDVDDGDDNYQSDQQLRLPDKSPTGTGDESGESEVFEFYRLMTTVAYPVFDQSNDSNHIGNLLGVAATDVHIEEMTKLASPYKLGANGYAFAITNNGYVLFHPDLRPENEGILKPDYNSVDLAEVEMPHNDLPPRGEDKYLLELRAKMIDRESSNSTLLVKIHLDNMKRVVTRINKYFYSPLNDTPFSFGIALPSDYGLHEIRGKIDLKPLSASTKSLDYKRRVLSLFEGDKWQVHPDWIYCQYLYSNPDRPVLNREETFLHFLNLIPTKGFSWRRHDRVKPLPKKGDYTSKKANEMNKNEHYCDIDLVESVIFDAQATKDFGHGVRSEPKRQDAADKNGITLSFVATRSGLTRWDEFEAGSKQFIKTQNRAIDEIWYKRAVDYHYINSEAFVLSVPFSGNPGTLRVTGSHAIFLDTNGMQAPAAVIGMQMKQSNFRKMFLNVTSECVNNNNKTCAYHCAMEELRCYLLDDNGFVIASSKNHGDNINESETGKFFGAIDRNIMNALVTDKIYKKINMVDYQAVCYDPIKISDSASDLLTPFIHARNILGYVWSKLAFFILKYNLYSWWNGDFAVANSRTTYDSGDFEGISLGERERTRQKPCDKKYDLYQLQPTRFVKEIPRRGKLYGCFSHHMCNKSFVVQLIPSTNLLFMAVDATCSCDESRQSLEADEIQYNEMQMCKWLKSNIYRKRPLQCTSYHPQELEIEGYCGSANKADAPLLLIVSFVIARWLCHRHFSS